MVERIRVAVSGKVLRRNVGGNTTYGQTLYDRLADLGVEHRVLVPPGCRSGPAGRSGLVRRVGYGTAEGLLWPRTVDRRHADLLHFPADTGALIGARVPVVATVHGVGTLRMPGVGGALWIKAWRARVTRLTAAADAVITVSAYSAREISQLFGVPARRLHVIPHGVDTKRFHTDPEGDAELLGPLRLPERFVLYLGNLDPRKNVPMLVGAMAHPEVAKLGVPLVVAGGSFLGAAPIQRLLANAPHVRYLGQVPGELVAPLLRAATVFALPSSYEGFGLPVVEAMACGTPVVTTDRGALPEVAGDAAMIINEVTPAALAAALREVLTDDLLGAVLRTRGLANVTRFTWAESARQHKEVFAGLLGGVPAAAMAP